LITIYYWINESICNTRKSYTCCRKGYSLFYLLNRKKKKMIDWFNFLLAVVTKEAEKKRNRMWFLLLFVFYLYFLLTTKQKTKNPDQLYSHDIIKLKNSLNNRQIGLSNKASVTKTDKCFIKYFFVHLSQLLSIKCLILKNRKMKFMHSINNWWTNMSTDCENQY